jgi:hypothetical protein
LRWAREVVVGDIETAGRFSSHVNGRLVGVAAGMSLGADVTARFSAVISQ